MFNNIIASYSNSIINTQMILSVLLMVFILSLYEFFIYRYVSHRSFYNKSYNITIAVLPFFISIIILCLQSNIYITLGTIGALAILRFKSAVKDPLDMLYLLWSVFNGIICGCQLYEAGVLTSIVVTLVLIAIEKISISTKPCVLIAHSENEAESKLEKLFKDNNIKFRIKSRNYTSKGYDYAIELVCKDLKELNQKMSKEKIIDKYSIIEYDADDII